MTKRGKKTTTAPKPVKLDVRICFAIGYYASEADAALAAAAGKARGDTYNGGYFDGMACGREKNWDYVDPVLGQLYAVTF